MKYDYLIVGAGLFGATCANLLNKKGIRNKLGIICDGSIIRGSFVRKTKVILEILFNKA